MKQITLEARPLASSTSFCSGRLLATWGLYGVAMWLVSDLAGPSLGGQVVAWLIALVIAGRMLNRVTKF
ncbi:MAG: hypothetical protein WA431_16955 [Candidatus Cybelea sp.]